MIFKTTLWFIACWITCVAAAGQESARSERDTLKGVKEFSVTISSLPEKAKALRITEERIRTIAELELRKAKIRIKKDAQAELAIGVNPVFSDKGDFMVFAVQISFIQPVTLTINGKSAIATTWQRGAIGTSGRGTAERIIEDSVRQNLEEFINDYLASNEDIPKSPSP